MIVSVLLLSACKSAGTVPAAAIQEVIAQTMQAVATDVQSTMKAAAPVVAPATKTPLPTDTPLPTKTPEPTQEPTPTETPTPTQASVLLATPTKAPVILAASGTTAHILTNANCRSGPSVAFPIVFTTQTGEDLNILARTESGDYLLVAYPKDPGLSCWLSSFYADIRGDLSALPVTTPPITPIPPLRYTIDYVETQPCQSWTVWSLEFKLKNIGTKTIQSYQIVVNDQTADTTETSSQNQFGDRVSCQLPNVVDYLEPGQIGYIYADDFTYDPYHHYLLVYVTVCSRNNLTGECESEAFFLTP